MFSFFSSRHRLSYIILTLAAASHDKMPPWERNGSLSFRRDAAYPHAKFQFPVRSRDPSEATRARRCETRRKTRVIVRWYFSFVNGTPFPPPQPPPVAIPQQLCPGGDQPIHRSYHPSFTNTKLSGIKGTLDTVGGTMSRGRS